MTWKSEKRNSCKAWVGKQEGKRQVARPRHKWENILKLILQKWDGNSWIGLHRDKG
jgi:hypothetical protein